jgi:hypothetical protein
LENRLRHAARDLGRWHRLLLHATMMTAVQLAIDRERSKSFAAA